MNPFWRWHDAKLARQSKGSRRLNRHYIPRGGRQHGKTKSSESSSNRARTVEAGRGIAQKRIPLRSVRDGNRHGGAVGKGFWLIPRPNNGRVSGC